MNFSTVPPNRRAPIGGGHGRGEQRTHVFRVEGLGPSSEAGRDPRRDAHHLSLLVRRLRCQRRPATRAETVVAGAFAPAPLAGDHRSIFTRCGTIVTMGASGAGERVRRGRGGGYRPGASPAMQSAAAGPGGCPTRRPRVGLRRLDRCGRARLRRRQRHRGRATRWSAAQGAVAVRSARTARRSWRRTRGRRLRSRHRLRRHHPLTRARTASCTASGCSARLHRQRPHPARGAARGRSSRDST